MLKKPEVAGAAEGVPKTPPEDGADPNNPPLGAGAGVPKRPVLGAGADVPKRLPAGAAVGVPKAGGVVAAGLAPNAGAPVVGAGAPPKECVVFAPHVTILDPASSVGVEVCFGLPVLRSVSTKLLAHTQSVATARSDLDAGIGHRASITDGSNHSPTWLAWPRGLSLALLALASRLASSYNHTSREEYIRLASTVNRTNASHESRR